MAIKSSKRNAISKWVVHSRLVYNVLDSLNGLNRLSLHRPKVDPIEFSQRGSCPKNEKVSFIKNARITKNVNPIRFNPRGVSKSRVGKIVFNDYIHAVLSDKIASVIRLIIYIYRLAI